MRWGEHELHLVNYWLWIVALRQPMTYILDITRYVELLLESKLASCRPLIQTIFVVYKFIIESVLWFRILGYYTLRPILAWVRLEESIIWFIIQELLQQFIVVFQIQILNLFYRRIFRRFSQSETFLRILLFVDFVAKSAECRKRHLLFVRRIINIFLV